MQKANMKEVILKCIEKILNTKNEEYATLDEIYQEVAQYLKVDNDYILQSQIRGRLQENCIQSKSFRGTDLFATKSLRSGLWKNKVNQKKYIRDRNNLFIITSDNWQNVKTVERIKEDYIIETNTDNIYRGKLRAKIGTERANIILKELDKIKEILVDSNFFKKENINYGNAFEVFAISTLHNLTYSECIKKYIILGNEDGKVDAIYYDQENVKIYQIKLGDIDYEDIAMVKDNYDLCRNNKVPTDGKNLYDFVKKHEEQLRGKEEKCYIISERLKSTEFHKKPEEIYQLFFENKLLTSENNNFILEILKPKQERNQYNVSKNANGDFSFFINAEVFIDSIIKSLGLEKTDKDTINSLSKYFTDNVRGVLKENKKMIDTIKYEPQNFVKYNNGINITGKVEDKGSAIIIRNPVINNGQQTVTTLISQKENLKGISIVIKITNEENMQIKGKISQYTNDQVKVKSIDMLSLNQNIRDLQKEIYHSNDSEEKYFLKIYTSGMKENDSLINKIYKKNNIIPLLDFLKVYFSILDPTKLGFWKNNPNKMIDEIIIDKTFDIDLSLKICRSIKDFKNYLEKIENKKQKDDLKSSDLAFIYLLVAKNMTMDEAKIIIENINKKYFYDVQEAKSKLIDIYKSTSIYKKLNEEIQNYKKMIMN